MAPPMAPAPSAAPREAVRDGAAGRGVTTRPDEVGRGALVVGRVSLELRMRDSKSSLRLGRRVMRKRAAQTTTTRMRMMGVGIVAFLAVQFGVLLVSTGSRQWLGG